MPRASLDAEIEIVRSICLGSGLGDVAPVLLHAGHHTTLLIQPPGVIARVQSSGPVEHARQTAELELAVARHLASQGAPAVAPVPELAGPHISRGAVTTLWPYLPGACAAGDGDAALAARALAAVHRGLLGYRGILPPYTQALDGCWGVLSDDAAMAALAAADRALLRSEFRRLRGEIKSAARDFVPLHGDSHPGNLLIGADGPVWIDWEDACVGPVERDIADLPRSAWAAFPAADRSLIQRFADLKSVCVAAWCWADLARSPAVREAAVHHLRRVRRRARRSAATAAVA